MLFLNDEHIRVVRTQPCSSLFEMSFGCFDEEPKTEGVCSTSGAN